jgi:hypothetical protein
MYQYSHLSNLFVLFEIFMLQAYMYICAVVCNATMNDMTHTIKLLILP